MGTVLPICGYLYIAIAVIFGITILRRIIKKEGFTARDKALPVIIVGIGFLYIIVLAFHYSEEIRLSDRIQILLMFGLVAVTTFYAWSASRQADASVKMVEEMREQRYSECLPLLVVAITQRIPHQGLNPDEHLYSVLQTGIGATFGWRNLGKGVAINARFSLWGLPLDSHPGKVLFFPPREAKALEVGAHVSIVFDYAGQCFDQPEIYCPRLEAEYLDIYERKVTTVQEFRIEEQNNNKRAFMGELYFTVNGRRLGEEVTQHD